MEMDEIRAIFPHLRNDNIAKITSPKTDVYNCIAWALVYDDRFVWPPESKLDAVFWPEGLPKNDDIGTFIRLFELYGHEICDSAVFEKGFRKIALYVDADMKCTHAARQKTDGLWYSKLGRENDIVHSTPEKLEGNDYGRVYCIMKKNLG